MSNFWTTFWAVLLALFVAAILFGCCGIKIPPEGEEFEDIRLVHRTDIEWRKEYVKGGLDNGRAGH